MFGLKAYLYAAAALAALSVVGYGWHLQAKVGTLTVQNDRLTANIATLQAVASQRAQAEAFADAQRASEDTARTEADNAQDTVRKVPVSECLDAPLPPEILIAIK